MFTVENVAELMSRESPSLPACEPDWFQMLG